MNIFDYRILNIGIPKIGTGMVVAGHVGTCVIADDPSFHDIYYDGESHYYIDGTVIDSRYIPVLLVDTDEDKYYQVTESGLIA